MNSSTGEFLISKEELARQSKLQPLDPKHRPAGPCQECMYRKEHHGVCSNCGRPRPKGK